MSTIQKIPSIWGILIIKNSYLINILIVINLIFLVFLTFNSHETKIIIGICRIYSNVLLIIRIKTSIEIFYFFLFSYFLTISLIFFMINAEQQVSVSLNGNEVRKTIIFISLIGIPPFPIFFRKIIVIKNIIFYSTIYRNIFFILLISSTLFITIMYFKLLLSSIGFYNKFLIFIVNIKTRYVLYLIISIFISLLFIWIENYAMSLFY